MHESESWRSVVVAREAYYEELRRLSDSPVGVPPALVAALRDPAGAAAFLRLLRDDGAEATMDRIAEVVIAAVEGGAHPDELRPALAALDGGWLALALRPLVDERLADHGIGPVAVGRLAALLAVTGQAALLDSVIAAAAGSHDPAVRAIAPDLAHPQRLHLAGVPLPGRENEPWWPLVEADRRYRSALEDLLRSPDAVPTFTAALALVARPGLALLLLRTAPVELVTELVEPLFAVAATPNSHMGQARDQLARLPRDVLAAALPPLVERALADPEADYGEWRAVAQLLDEVGQRPLLDLVLDRAAASADPDISEIADDYDRGPSRR